MKKPLKNNEEIPGRYWVKPVAHEKKLEAQWKQCHPAASQSPHQRRTDRQTSRRHASR